MESYQQRVVDEKSSLDENLRKLESFFSTDTYRSLPDEEKHWLSCQEEAMSRYSFCLGKRIANFKP